jgi:predicted enzyme related to lactoylglutathione lyase
MPEIQKHLPGSFCWAEVGTADARRAKAFYGDLFGWTFDDRPAGAFGVYTMCKLRGKDLAGLYEMPPDLLKKGVPPHWMSYIAVADADAACAKIRQHGGRVEQGPFDVMEVGRMAICQDPTGATFSVWQAKAHSGATVMGEVGTPCWFELATKGVEKAERFYRDVFGWSVKLGTDGMPYRELTASGASYPMGGMMELTPQHGPVPPHWMIYFTVNDCDADAKRCQALGGKVYVPPMDIPTVGRFAVLADPTGATFAIIKLALDPTHGHEKLESAAAPTPSKAPEIPKASATGKSTKKK